MSLILNLETSSKNCSVSLSSKGKLIDLIESEDENYRHSELLTTSIKDILSKNNLNVKSLDAISVGIILALKFSLDRKIISEKFYNRICDIMKKLDLNMHIDSKFNVNKIIEVMLKDKKSRQGKIGLVLIKDISKTVLS